MEKLKFTVRDYDADREPLGEMVRKQLDVFYCYIHGKAETLAGYDIADYIDGDIMQMKQPVELQDIEMILPDKTVRINSYYSCCDDYFLLIMQGDDENKPIHSDPYTCKSDYCKARYRLIEKPIEDKRKTEFMRKMGFIKEGE